MSLSLVLPLSVGTAGLESFPDEAVVEAVQQNFRMMLLTAPGEYVMDINFGVGLRNYLFQLANAETTNMITSEIMKQSTIYMPYVLINNIDVDLSNIDANVFALSINYNISEIAYNQVLELSIGT